MPLSHGWPAHSKAHTIEGAPLVRSFARELLLLFEIESENRALCLPPFRKCAKEWGTHFIDGTSAVKAWTAQRTIYVGPLLPAPKLLTGFLEVRKRPHLRDG